MVRNIIYLLLDRGVQESGVHHHCLILTIDRSRIHHRDDNHIYFILQNTYVLTTLIQIHKVCSKSARFHTGLFLRKSINWIHINHHDKYRPGPSINLLACMITVTVSLHQYPLTRGLRYIRRHSLRRITITCIHS